MDNLVKKTFDSRGEATPPLSSFLYNYLLLVCSLLFGIVLLILVTEPTLSSYYFVLFTLVINVICLPLFLFYRKNFVNFIPESKFINISHYSTILLFGTLSAFSIICIQLYISNALISTYPIIIGVLLLTTFHLSSIINLSEKYKIFLLFIIPSLLALFYTALHTKSENFQNLLIISLILYCALILILGYQAHKFYQNKITSIKSKLEEDFDQQKKELIHQNSSNWHKKIEFRTEKLENLNNQLTQYQQNLDLAHEAAGIATWYWDLEDNAIHTRNFKKIFGYNVESIDSYFKALDKYIHPNDLENFKTSIREHLNGKTDRYDAVFRVRHATEGWIWIHDIGRVIKRHPNTKAALQMVGIRRNINTEKQHEEQVSLSNRVFRLLNQGFFVLDSKLTYTHANPFFLKMVGLTEEEVIGQHIFDVSKGHNAELQKLHLDVLKHLMTHGNFEGEILEEFQNGKLLPLHMDINAVYNSQNKITQYVGLATDLTERKSSEKRVSYLENYDTLTDLPNRLYFNKVLHDHVNNDPRFNNKFAVLRINLDRFRYYNELLNQAGGDELLKEVAKRLRLVGSDTTLTARLNSDDFAVIWEIKNSTTEVTTYCKRLIQAFEETFKINHQEFIMTLSIGIAFFPDHGRQIDSLNLHAELALLEAKRIGGNAVRIYRDEPHLASEPRLKLESELRMAIQRDELVLYYQPKLCGQTHKITGFEALIRWNHPQHGILLPAQFIPLAEETSLISDIGRIVIEKTCAQIKKWSDIGFNNISVSINVVVQQLNRGNLLDEIDYNIKKYNIDSKQLEVEITETSLMENSESVRKVMSGLKDRQITVSLDDFGIGYSSLAYLNKYPFDIIKIDRSFVAGIGNSNKEAIVKAIIAMAKAMNKKVVAEGVETQHHCEFLMHEECDFLQGYLIGKPMPADMATNMLKDNLSDHLANLSLINRNLLD